LTGILTYMHSTDTKAKEMFAELESPLQAVKWIDRDIRDFQVYSDKLVEILQTRTPGYDWVGFYLVRSDEFILTASKGAGEPDQSNYLIRHGVVGRAAVSGAPVTDKDIPPFQSQAAVPVDRFGVIFGIIHIRSTRKNLFNPAHIEFLEDVVRAVGARYHGGPL
jgi:putative methionine-R-sulfoxide reductase with GAF domain